MNLTIELDDPVGVIYRELADKGSKQKDVAITYAFIIAQEGLELDYGPINAAIRARWPKGLRRVKEAAWRQLAEWQARGKAEAISGGGNA